MLLLWLLAAALLPRDAGGQFFHRNLYIRLDDDCASLQTAFCVVWLCALWLSLGSLLGSFKV